MIKKYEQLIDQIWKSENEDKKPPKGFEKFFKKKEEREKESKSATKKGKWG